MMIKKVLRCEFCIADESSFGVWLFINPAMLVLVCKHCGKRTDWFLDTEKQLGLSETEPKGV